MTDFESNEQQEPDESAFTNFASGNSRVGAQFGTVIGDVHTYQVPEGQPPRARYLTALSFLKAKMARRAAELIRQAVEEGLTGDVEESRTGDPGPKITANHIAYHWILSVLSGRSFEQLDEGHFATIELARQTGNEDRSDPWLAPLDLIVRLVGCLRRQEQDGGQEAELGTLLTEYSALPDGIRDEVREDFERHLDLILEDTVVDQLLADIAEAAIAKRMSSNREQRAWKFFQAVPEPPRARTVGKTSLSRSTVVTAAFGGVLGGVGLVLSLYAIISVNVIGGILLMLLLACSGFAAYKSGIVVLAAGGRLADKEREYGNPTLSRYSVSYSFAPANTGKRRSNDDPPGGSGRKTIAGQDQDAPAAAHRSARAQQQPSRAGEPSGSAEHDAADARQEKAKARAEQEAADARYNRFARAARRHIDHEFTDQAPQAPDGRRAWETATARIKDAMKEEVVNAYRGAEQASLDWLITWRVKEIARRYREGTLFDYRDELRPPGWARAALRISIAILLLGVLALLAGTFSSSIGIGLIVLMLLPLAGVTVRASRLDVYLVVRYRLPSDRQDAKERSEAERAEFERWELELRDRPSDAEIARWLDYDKLYLRVIAMKRLGVAGRQLITHATLTEAAPGSRGARIIHGPPRYSAYVVTIFLLTETGVRRLAIRLNFETGIPSDHVRQSFQYNAIAWAGLLEIGVRFDNGSEPKALVPTDGQRLTPGDSLVPAPPDDRLRTADGSPILRQDFFLVLVTGQSIRISVESFDEDFRDISLEDSRELLDLALESSGISSALKVLETVAAQGRDWLVRGRRWRSRQAPGLRAVPPSPGDSGPGKPPEDDAA